jgi:hypothetical protein
MSAWLEFEEPSVITAALAVAVHENKANWYSGGNFRLVLRGGVRREFVDENITMTSRLISDFVLHIFAVFEDSSDLLPIKSSRPESTR